MVICIPTNSEVWYWSHFFTDVAIHYYKDFIFFSNKSGDVYRLSRTNANSVISIYRSTKHPGPLSVDWLHDRIYIAEDRAVCIKSAFYKHFSPSYSQKPERPITGKELHCLCLSTFLFQGLHVAALCELNHDIFVWLLLVQIISCNLDGSSRSVDLDNLPSRPTHIVADPFNGWAGLFLLIQI